MPQTLLFSAADLSGFLHQQVTESDAAATERVVWGWLKPLLDLEQRPANPSDELVAWAIELGAIAYANPEGLTLYALESEKSEYSGERRDEILNMAASGGTTAPGSAPKPRGNFPPPSCYPDPARSFGWGGR